LKHYFYILVLTCLFASCSKEQKEVKNNTDKLDFYLNEIKNNNRKSIDDTKYLNDKLLSILKNQKNTVANRKNLQKVLGQLNDLGEFSLLQSSAKILLRKANDSKDTLSAGYSYYFFGQSAFKREVLDSAYLYFSKAEKILISKDTKLLGNLFLNKSSIQLRYNDFLGAENSASQALKYSRLNPDLLCQYDSYTNLGIASIGNENYSKSIEYHFKALDLVVDNKLFPEYFLREISLNNIGNCYQNLKQYNKAIEAFEKALKNTKLKSSKPIVYATLLDNLAYCKFKNGDKNNFENLFLESLKICDSLKLDSKVVYSKIHLSEFFYERDTIKAQIYAKEALDVAKRTKNSNDLLLSLKQLSLVEHKNAARYSKDYIKISDSLQQEERKAKDKFARIAFETDEIIQEKDKLAEQNRNLLYFFLGTLFVGLLLFVIRTQRAKNRELLLKQQQQKVNEEIYNLMISQQATIEENRVKEKKRIAQELHDGVLGRLFGARLNLDSLNRFTDEESVNSRFNYLAELKNIEQDIREISHDLNREKYVLINNFVAIVSNLLEEQSNSFEAVLLSSLDESIQWDKVANNVKINLYRILQESLQNINKYANAKNISVELRKDNGQIVLKISDDGIGFDVNTKKKGIGLQNMQSRVQECEGTFEIKSKKGKGTTTVVMVPLEKVSVDL
jgi:signal transduction histidine kinase